MSKDSSVSLSVEWGLVIQGIKDLLLFLANLGWRSSLPLGFRLLFRRHASSPFPNTSHFQNSIPLLTIEVYYWDYGCACVKRYQIISLNTPTSLLHTTFRTRFHYEPEWEFWFGFWLGGNTIHLHDFSIPLDFLVIKDLQKNIKGQKKFQRP